MIFPPPYRSSLKKIMPRNPTVPKESERWRYSVSLPRSPMRSPARSGCASGICRCRRRNYSSRLNKHSNDGHMRNRSTLKVARDSGFAVMLAILATAFYAWAQSEDELIRGAKKEGKVVFWSSMRIEDSRALAAGFEARYPFIKVDIFRA